MNDIYDVADLMDKCTAIIHRILERESRGWYIKFKDKIIAEVKGNLIYTIILLKSVCQS